MHIFVLASLLPKYSYSFSWQDKHIIHHPQNILAMQVHTWLIKPDLIKIINYMELDFLVITRELQLILQH